MDKLFIIINIDNLHWVLVGAFMKRKVLVYFDGKTFKHIIDCPNYGKIFLDTIMSYLVELSKFVGSEFCGDGWRYELVPTMTKQIDGHSCGLIAIVTLLEQINELDVIYNCSTESMLQLRNTMAWVVLNGRFPCHPMPQSPTVLQQALDAIDKDRVVVKKTSDVGSWFHNTKGVKIILPPVWKSSSVVEVECGDEDDVDDDQTREGSSQVNAIDLVCDDETSSFYFSFYSSSMSENE